LEKTILYKPAATEKTLAAVAVEHVGWKDLGDSIGYHDGIVNL
jgi:hypothetical protein